MSLPATAKTKTNDPVEFIIVGTGFSGLCAAIKLVENVLHQLKFLKEGIQSAGLGEIIHIRVRRAMCRPIYILFHSS